MSEMTPNTFITQLIKSCIRFLQLNLLKMSLEFLSGSVYHLLLQTLQELIVKNHGSRTGERMWEHTEVYK